MYKTKTGLWRHKTKIDGEVVWFSGKTRQEIVLKMALYREAQNHSPLFKTIAEDWKEAKWERISLGTQRCYAAPFADVVRSFGDMEIQDITAKDVQKYLNNLSVSYKSALTRKGIISMIFDYAMVDLDMDLKNPCDRVKVDTRMRRGHRDALAPEEISAIKETTEDELILAPLIYYTGCRCGEALALQYKDIDFDNKIVHITKAVSHQGNQPYISPTKTVNGIRDVPLLPQLESLLPKKFRKADYIVSGEKPLTKSALDKRWKKWEKNHNVRFDRHSIRHTYATMLYESGIDVKSAQKLLGHANFQTTMDIYTHLSDTHLKEAQQKLADYIK